MVLVAAALQLMVLLVNNDANVVLDDCIKVF
jgi:hypothetical protein